MKTILALLLVIMFPATALAASATLTWTDNSNNEKGFDIQRKADTCAGPTAWANFAIVGPNIQTYKDLLVTEGSTYCYRVDAWNTVNGLDTGTKQISAFTNEAEIKIPFGIPVPPTGLGVVATP